MKTKHDPFVKLKTFTSVALGRVEITAFEPFLLETDGERFANVKCCTGITEYMPDRVILKCEKLSTVITGENLFINIFSFEETRVTGNIKEIEFVK